MEYPKRKIIKGHESFNDVIGDFCTNLTKIVERLATSGPDDKIYVCAISRKTPRLLDMLKNDLASIWSRLQIFTEIALPFIDWTRVKTIILMDDAIYFGSTFNHYYNLIKSYKTGKLDIIPMCCIKASETSLTFDEKLKASIRPRVYGHYFVKSLAERFCEQYTPFEIEFPAFDIDLPDNTAEKTYGLYKELQIKRGDGVYEISRLEMDDNNDCCFEFGMNLDKNNDLRKLRFYVRGSRLTISSIFANAIPQQDIETKVCMKNKECQQLWNIIVNKAETLYHTRQKDNAYYRALCVWYNYICSLISFMDKKQLIFNVLHKVYETSDFSMNIRPGTIEQIVGYDNTKDIYEIINKNILQENKVPLSDLYISSVQLYKEQEYLPQRFEYINYYYAMQKKYIKRCSGNLKQELSCMVYLQCVMIDKMNRSFFVLDNERLKYGSTFRSIKETLALYTDKKGRNINFKEVHAWIDKNIDRATIVPQYITYNTEQDGTIWVRVMRSGENELSFIGNWCRLFLFVIQFSIQCIGYDKIDQRICENLMSWIYYKFRLDEYFGEDVFIKYKDSAFQLYMNEEDIGLSELMEKFFMVDIENEAMGINDQLLDTELLEGLVLPQQITDSIKENIQNLWNWNSKFELSNPLTLFFNLYFRLRLTEGIGKQKKNTDNLASKVKEFLEYIIETQLQVNDNVIIKITSLRHECLRSMYNDESLALPVDDIPENEKELMDYVESINNNITTSDTMIFWDVVSDILLNGSVDNIPSITDGHKKLLPIAELAKNCIGTQKDRALCVLQQTINTNIIYELFD